MKVTIYFIILVICLVLSAFFSAADMAYSCVNQLRLRKDVEKGRKSSSLAYSLSSQYDKTISTILFGNNLVNILASSIATLLGMELGGDLGMTIAPFIFLGVLLVVGEIFPKSIAKTHSYSCAKIFSYPIQIFKIIFYPITWLFSKIAFVLTYPFYKNKKKEEDVISDDELQEMVDTIEEEGVIEKGEASILRGAIDFRDTQAFEIMTPRVDVFGFDINDNIEELISNNEIYIHSRIPIYEDTIDNIIGIVSSKVLLKEMLKGNKIDLSSIMVKPMFVPRSKRVNDILQDFKKTKTHIAVVVDEFGGTEGILTMEDILEEIVGEIWDEMDVQEEVVEKKTKGTFIVDGSMNLDDFFDEFDVDEDEETDSSTLSGFIIEKLGRFAEIGDRIKYQNLTLEVIKVDEFTIEKVKVRIRKKVSSHS